MESPNREGPSALLRYSIAMVFMVYGFAKITGAQFIAIESELDRPMRDVSGFWLTWYYFGYSAWYRLVIALGEIVGAFLLTFRRTTLLGALILFGMAVNVMLQGIPLQPCVPYVDPACFEVD